jgi:hypothetical protein
MIGAKPPIKLRAESADIGAEDAQYVEKCRLSEPKRTLRARCSDATAGDSLLIE